MPERVGSAAEEILEPSRRSSLFLSVDWLEEFPNEPGGVRSVSKVGFASDTFESPEASTGGRTLRTAAAVRSTVGLCFHL